MVTTLYVIKKKQLFIKDLFLGKEYLNEFNFKPELEYQVKGYYSGFNKPVVSLNLPAAKILSEKYNGIVEEIKGDPDEKI